MLFFNSPSNSNRTRGRKCETGEGMMVGNNKMRKGREEMGIQMAMIVILKDMNEKYGMTIFHKEIKDQESLVSITMIFQ